VREHGRIIVFTDLDGTLLDETYSFSAARQSLELLSGKGIPLILCSSKTRVEVEHYRALLRNRHPFVSENGGGIFVPEDYFPDETVLARHGAIRDKNCSAIRLGMPYVDLRAEIVRLRAMGFDITGFGDLSVEGVAARTGLSPGEAALSKVREFDEPFFFEGDADLKQDLIRAVRDRGLQVTEGRILHITGDNDKGKATALLSTIYREHSGICATIALGDGPNDLPMLQCVDYPAAVRRSDGTVHPALSSAGFMQADGIGPAGWNQLVPRLLALAGLPL
jgi:mannosyl-3-phosphoglycerate phosphatase family protein